MRASLHNSQQRGSAKLLVAACLFHALHEAAIQNELISLLPGNMGVHLA
jgi:hypothetical protein